MKTLLFLFFIVFSINTYAANWGEAVWGEARWGDDPIVQQSDEDIPIPGWALLALMVSIMTVAKRQLNQSSANSLSFFAATFLGLLILLMPTPLSAQAVEVPHVFSNGTVIDPDAMNENFDVLENAIENGLVGPAGATGPQGVAGPQGPEGPPGPTTTSFSVCFKRIGNVSPSSLSCGCSRQLSRQEAFAGGSCRATSDVGACSQSTTGSTPQVALCCVCAQ